MTAADPVSETTVTVALIENHLREAVGLALDSYPADMRFNAIQWVLLNIADICDLPNRAIYPAIDRIEEVLHDRDGTRAALDAERDFFARMGSGSEPVTMNLAEVPITPTPSQHLSGWTPEHLAHHLIFDHGLEASTAAEMNLAALVFTHTHEHEENQSS